MRSILNKCGNFFFKIRNALFPLIFFGLIIVTRPQILSDNIQLDLYISLLGVFIAFCGIAFRFTVIGFAYIQRGGRDKKPYADTLQCQGIYAHTRNPMYVGNMLICIGLAMAYGSLAAFLFLVIFFSFVYRCIIVAEEDFLGNKFGSHYEEYCKDVPGFFPKLKGLTETLSEMHFDWKKSLRKDYGTIFGTLTAIIFILFYKEYLLLGLKAATAGLILEGILFAAYLYVRYLKKSNQLGRDQDPLTV